MTAYLLVDIAEIRDAALYAEYRATVSPTLERVSASYIVRGGDPKTLAGEWHPTRLVLVAFADLGKARAWWASDDYAELKHARQCSTSTNMILVDGPAEPPAQSRTEGAAFVILASVASATLSDWRGGLASGIAGAGGCVLTLDGSVDVLEGDWRPAALAICQFPSADIAERWWVSASIAGDTPRQRQMDAVLVHGIAGVSQ